MGEPELWVWGVGNALRGDDAVGCRVAGLLMERGVSGVTDCGVMPENHVAALREGKPRVLLIVDAADMGLPPGECRRLSLDGLDGVLDSTHGIPLPFLLAPFDVETEVLGIQPGSLKLGAPLTDVVEQSALRVAELIQRGQWRSIRKG